MSIYVNYSIYLLSKIYKLKAVEEKNVGHISQTIQILRCNFVG